MDEQRWILDSVIRLIGPDWDQGRTRYLAQPCGPDADVDFQRLRDRIRKFADVDREFAAAARRREQLGDQARAEGHRVAEREHAFVASILWGGAQWPLFGDSPLVQAYGRRKVECYRRFIALAPHPVERVEIPFGETTLPGYLHLPRSGVGTAPYPAVIQVGGMDSFKEHLVAMYGDRYLERGICRLTFDGPGQGESLDRGLLLTAGNFVDAGRAVVDWMRARPEVDATRLGIAGVSFGSLWATQVASAVDGLAGCAVSMVAHEPGAYGAFTRVSPTFKARFMSMTGIRDEAEFDAFAQSLTLVGIGSGIDCPYLVEAGEEDDLSAIEATWQLLSEIRAPREFVLYQGERHGIAGGPAASMGPIRDDVLADWFVDRFAGKPLEDTLRFVDTAGRVQRHPLDGPFHVEQVVAGTVPRSAPLAPD
jgi:dienelactone hydrolase